MGRGLVAALTLSALLLTLLLAPPHASAQTSGETVGVYYIGPEDAVAAAIDLASPYIVRVDQPELATVVVINNVPLQETLSAFSDGIQQERTGLVLFCGSLFPQSTNDLRRLLGFSTFGLDQVAEPSRVSPADRDDPLVRALTWTSAPVVHSRTIIDNANLLLPIIATGGDEGTTSSGVIQRVRGRDTTQALIVGGWMTHPSNEAWTSWPYFNYLIYRVIYDAAGIGRPLSYTDYPGSPTPQRTSRWAIAGAGVGVLLGSLAVFYGARRRLFLGPPTPPQSADRRQPGSTAAAWQQAGFRRPLAGFLAYLPLGVLLAAPSAAFQLYVLPEILFTDAQGYGLWAIVGRWTLAAWVLLDAGTGTAAVRHFAATRTHQPERAARYLQFHVWWQFLSGAAQIAVVGLLSAFAMPAVGLAHFTYYLLARALLQIPGFLSVFGIAARARQRFDHEQLLNLFAQVIVPLLQIGAVVVFLSVGEARPELGVGVAGAIGLTAGALIGEGLTFLLGARLHRQDGQTFRALFVPAFDGKTSREVLAFGIPWAVGAAIPAVGAVIQVLLLDGRLTALGIDTGVWASLIGVTAAFEVLLTGLYLGLMPALAEAAPFGYKTLLRHYVSQSIRYGAWTSLMLFAAISAIAGNALRLVPWLGESPLAPWLLPIMAWGALRWAAWLPDRMLEAAGKPALVTLLATLEQGIRLGSAPFLIALWGLPGLPAAYVAGLLVRAIVGRALSSRHLVKARIHVWQSLIAPAISAVIIYQALQWASTLGGGEDWQTSVAIGVALLLPALLVHGLLTALLGGWDDGGLAELRRAADISGIGRPFAWLLWQCVRLGSRISPLHGRFPMPLYALADDEAQSLTVAQQG